MKIRKNYSIDKASHYCRLGEVLVLVGKKEEGLKMMKKGLKMTHQKDLTTAYIYLSIGNVCHLLKQN